MLPEGKKLYEGLKAEAVLCVSSVPAALGAAGQADGRFSRPPPSSLPLPAPRLARGPLVVAHKCTERVVLKTSKRGRAQGPFHLVLQIQ